MRENKHWSILYKTCLIILIMIVLLCGIVSCFAYLLFNSASASRISGINFDTQKLAYAIFQNSDMLELPENETIILMGEAQDSYLLVYENNYLKENVFLYGNETNDEPHYWAAKAVEGKIEEVWYGQHPISETELHEYTYAYQKKHVYFVTPFTPFRFFSTSWIDDSEILGYYKTPADSEIFQAVNTKENAYSISVHLTPNRNIRQLLSISESAYSVAFSSDAQIGKMIDLELDSSCKPEKITLEFTIKDAYIHNTLNKYSEYEEMQGIKRLCVFKYFDEINMMLPIYTDYDMEKNLVYADIDGAGTYCLIDMEIWFDLLDIEPDSVRTSDDETER